MTTNDNQEQSREKYFDNSLLRREAGEGWHPAGLNEEVLGAIVVRECLLDRLVAAGGALHADEEIMNRWMEQLKFVTDLKKQKGIGKPDPLSDEDA